MSVLNGTRNNVFKLEKNTSVKHEEEVPAAEIVEHGNTLPRKVVESPSLEAFKNRLNKYLSGMTYDPF